VLTDPISVTYNSSAKSMARVSQNASGTVYRTADGEFDVVISDLPARNGNVKREITLTRTAPDPTPSDPFDTYRRFSNSFSICYEVPSNKVASSVDIPLLRTALLAFVDSTLQGRIIGGEM
jgi:hypothetical protein